MSRPLPAVALAPLLIVALMFGAIGCSSDDPDSSASTTTRPRLPVPDGCSGATDDGGIAGDATTTTLPPRCLDIAYAEGLAQTGSAEVKKLTDQQRISFGRGVCDYAKALTASKEPPPPYREFLASTSQSWGVPAAVVDEIYESAKGLCPADIEVLTTMKSTTDPIEVDQHVGGSGDASITFSLPDGTTETIQTIAPWDQTLHLLEAVDVSVSASGSAELTCSITLAGEALVEQEVDSTSGAAVCTANAQTIQSKLLFE